jgi:hypothetical protein
MTSDPRAGVVGMGDSGLSWKSKPSFAWLTRFLRFTKEPKGYLEVASTEIRNDATAARLG